MKKIITFLSLIIVLSLSLTACSSSDKKSDSKSKSKSDSESTKTTKKSSGSDKTNAILQASAASNKQKSVEIEGTITIESNGSTGVMKISGKQNFENNDSMFTLDATALFGALGGGAAVPSEPILIETRTTGGYIYTKSPSLFGVEGKWTKAKASNPAANASQDPSQFLQFIKGASNDYKSSGTEEVDGVSTTKYSVTLDPELFKQQSKAAAGEEDSKAIIDSMSKSFTKPIPAVIWIDKDSLVRKFEMTFTLDSSAFLGGVSGGAATGSGSTLTMKTSLSMKNYGVKFTVDVPAGATES